MDILIFQNFVCHLLSKGPLASITVAHVLKVTCCSRVCLGTDHICNYTCSCIVQNQLKASCGCNPGFLKLVSENCMSVNGTSKDLYSKCSQFLSNEGGCLLSS